MTLHEQREKLKKLVRQGQGSEREKFGGISVQSKRPTVGKKGGESQSQRPRVGAPRSLLY